MLPGYYGFGLKMFFRQKFCQIIKNIQTPGEKKIEKYQEKYSCLDILHYAIMASFFLPLQKTYLWKHMLFLTSKQIVSL